MSLKKQFGDSFLEKLTIAGDYQSKRISSWDRTGKNYDWYHLKRNEKIVIADIKGPGSIQHFYAIPISLDPFLYRNVIIRMYWDEEIDPSVEVPLGDFFGIGHCKPRLFTSLLITVNHGDPIWTSVGLNSYFPMPFCKSAKIEIENESDIPLDFWYHVDYQAYEEIDKDVMYFHAQWQREKLTKVTDHIAAQKNITLWEGANPSGEDNYVIMEAYGNGQLVGILLEVDNIAGKWWGEGDDMVFIDGEKWPPSLHGTGTEEIFGGGACPTKEYAGPYTGFPLISNTNYYRQVTMYRFFVNDPIRFRKSIKYTIEHGHANNYENDYASVGYWYQTEPHKTFLPLLKAPERLPFLAEGEKEAISKQIEVVKLLHEKYEKLNGGPQDIAQSNPKMVMIREAAFMTKCKAMEAYCDGKYDHAYKEWELFEKFVDTL